MDRTTKAHVTHCPKCNLTWFNQDNRPYDNDYCMQCRGKLEYKGLQTVKVGGQMANPFAKTEIRFREGVE